MLDVHVLSFEFSIGAVQVGAEIHAKIHPLL